MLGREREFANTSGRSGVDTSAADITVICVGMFSI